MTANHNKLKNSTLSLAGVQFEEQLTDFKLNNDSDDPEQFYTYSPTGAFQEAADDAYSLELKFFADWRAGGISDFLVANDGSTVAFTLSHNTDIVGQYVRWTGSVLIKAPTVGGEVRTTELTETKLGVIGKPVYSRVG